MSNCVEAGGGNYVGIFGNKNPLAYKIRSDCRIQAVIINCKYSFRTAQTSTLGIFFCSVQPTAQTSALQILFLQRIMQTSEQ